MTSIVDALEVTAAQAHEQEIVRRLIQLYQHDFSEFARIDEDWGDVDDKGLFSFISLKATGRMKRRKPFLFRLNGKLTGFAFVNDWSPSGRPVDWCMSEYFVLRKYRRSGIGTHAARGIIAAYPGVWEIAIASFNAPAQIFWRNILSRLMYEVEELSGDGVSWSGPIFRLTARQRP